MALPMSLVLRGLSLSGLGRSLGSFWALGSGSMVLLFVYGSVACASLRTDVLACTFMPTQCRPFFESLPWLVCPMGASVLRP